MDLDCSSDKEGKSRLLNFLKTRESFNPVMYVSLIHKGDNLVLPSICSLSHCLVINLLQCLHISQDKVSV